MYERNCLIFFKNLLEKSSLMNYTLNFSVYLKQAYTFICHLYFGEVSWVGIFCSESYFCPREINGKKEVYKEKYIFVHDSLPVWCIHESYWKYVPWNQRKQYVYTKNVPQSSPIKCLIKIFVDSWLVLILK